METQKTRVVPFSMVDCGGHESAYVESVLASGWLTTASWALKFEKAVGNFTGAKHAIAVNSCTAALHLGMEALGIKEGDRVLVPSMTFTASAEVIRYLGADPVFLDVDFGTRTVTPEIIEAALIKHAPVKACVIVHYGGQAAKMLDDAEAGILNVCKKHNVLIIEDAAHAFPAKDQDTMVGNIGDVTCLSFYANKTMTTAEGGMLLTNNDEVANRASLMRLHGIDKTIWNRFTSTDKSKSWEYDVLAPGYKYNMPDINAAIGMAQFERLEPMRRAREMIAQRYINALSAVKNIILCDYRVAMESNAWHLFPICLDDACGIDRDNLILELNSHGIGTSVHYKPLHRMTYYKEKYNLRSEDFPNSEKIWRSTISLPIYSLLTESDQEYVIDTLLKYCDI